MTDKTLVSVPLSLEAANVCLSFKDMVENMTEGQMIHLANYLWKHHSVGATQLIKQAAENEEVPDSYVVNGHVYYR